MQDMSRLVIRHVSLKIMGGQIGCSEYTRVAQMTQAWAEFCNSRFEHTVLIEKRKKV